MRIVRGAPGIPFKANESEIQTWVETLVQDIVTRHLDGVTFDYESPLSFDDPDVKYVFSFLFFPNESSPHNHQQFLHRNRETNHRSITSSQSRITDIRLCGLVTG